MKCGGPNGFTVYSKKNKHLQLKMLIGRNKWLYIGSLDALGYPHNKRYMRPTTQPRIIFHNLPKKQPSRCEVYMLRTQI